MIGVERLVKHFSGPGGQVRAVDGVSFTIDPGMTVGLVGESGCGKSTVGRTILNLLPPTSGRVLFDGRDMFALSPAERRRLRREMAIVFQNPYSALNPRLNVLDIVGEPLRTHLGSRGGALKRRVCELLEKVGLEPDHLHRFPHQFSGGQRQRIAISRALALDPRFVILDEPTSALDVSVQAQVLNLIRDLQQRLRLTYLFITHDLYVIRNLADQILVMYLGQVVESGDVASVFEKPLHPYTKALLAAIPRADPAARTERTLLEGDVPSPVHPPSGCRFHPRCPDMSPDCRLFEPQLYECQGRRVACRLYHNR